MLLHIVFFDFRDGVSGEKKAEVLDAARALASIPGVSGLRTGKRISAAGDFSHAIYMYFEDAAALEDYRNHPDHLRFRDELFLPFVSKKQSVDYEDA